MMDYSLSLHDFTADLGVSDSFALNPSVVVAPTNLSWDRIGGPATASFSCYGFDYDYVFNLLGKIVVVYDRDTVPIWWGQFDEIKMVVDGYNLTYSLKNVVNSVSVFYTELTAGSSGSGTPKETTPVTEPDSINRYGLREKKYTLSNVSSSAANLKATYELEVNKIPRLTPTVATSGTNGAGSLSATGFLGLTQNEYYENPNTADVDSIEQIQTILALSSILNGAQIHGGVQGVLTNENQNGKNTALSIIKKLAGLGTASNKALCLLTGVSGVTVIRESTGTTLDTYLLYPDGRLVTQDSLQLVTSPTTALGGYVEVVIPSVRIRTQKQIIDKVKLDMKTGKFAYSLLGQSSPFNFNLVGVG